MLIKSYLYHHLVKRIFLINLFYVYICVSNCMYVYHLHAEACGSQRGH